MRDGHLTIGQLSRRAGLPVKTIRYYSDEGLLPPSERSDAGYRLYSEGDLARLDLILTLREAGLSLTTIGAVLARDLSLAEALELRLQAIEAHIVSLQHVAAAIRAALQTETDEDDPRRLHAVTRLSNEERRAVIERFYRQVAEGIAVDEDWTRSMIDASAPRLPDEPSKEQPTRGSNYPRSSPTRPSWRRCGSKPPRVGVEGSTSRHRGKPAAKQPRRRATHWTEASLRSRPRRVPSQNAWWWHRQPRWAENRMRPSGHGCSRCTRITILGRRATGCSSASSTSSPNGRPG
jgi:DNA-binding transcriptional MerR regulator